MSMHLLHIVDNLLDRSMRPNYPQFLHKGYLAYPPVLTTFLRCTAGQREISTTFGRFIISCYQEK